MKLVKEHLIPLSAVFVILVGVGSSVYVHATQQEIGETINIGDEAFTFEQLFQMCEYKILEDIDISGIALDDIILKAGVSSPELHEYTIIGADVYQKTVSWENLKNGVLTEERSVAFSDLPKAFRVRDVIEIKVT
jgi:hypothetical protein